MICIVKTATHIAYADHTSYPYMLGMKSNQYMLNIHFETFSEHKRAVNKLQTAIVYSYRSTRLKVFFNIYKNLIITCTIWH